MINKIKKRGLFLDSFFPKNHKVSSPKNSFFPKNHKEKMNFSIPRILPNSRRGLSGVITAVIMIALVFALVAIVWMVVNNIVTDELEDVESCLGIYGKVAINSRYTCYDSISNEFQFSISIADIEVDKVLVSISGEGVKKGLEISNKTSTIQYLRNYPDGSSGVKLPGKNGGLTYTYDLTGAGFSNRPDSIEISPTIKGKQCEISDSLLEIDDCLSLGG